MKIRENLMKNLNPMQQCRKERGKILKTWTETWLPTSSTKYSPSFRKKANLNSLSKDSSKLNLKKTVGQLKDFISTKLSLEIGCTIMWIFNLCKFLQVFKIQAVSCMEERNRFSTWESAEYLSLFSWKGNSSA